MSPPPHWQGNRTGGHFQRNSWVQPRWRVMCTITGGFCPKGHRPKKSSTFVKCKDLSASTAEKPWQPTPSHQEQKPPQHPVKLVMIPSLITGDHRSHSYFPSVVTIFLLAQQCRSLSSVNCEFGVFSPSVFVWGLKFWTLQIHNLRNATLCHVPKNHNFHCFLARKHTKGIFRNCLHNFRPLWAQWILVWLLHFDQTITKGDLTRELKLRTFTKPHITPDNSWATKQDTCNTQKDASTSTQKLFHSDFPLCLSPYPTRMPILILEWPPTCKIWTPENTSYFTLTPPPNEGNPNHYSPLGWRAHSKPPTYQTSKLSEDSSESVWLQFM